MGERPGTFKVREVSAKGTPIGDTRINAKYVLAVTKTEHGSMIRMHGASDRIFSDESASEVFKRWSAAK